MARELVKYKKLMVLRKSLITKQQEEDGVFDFLHKEKIRRFLSDNKVVIEIGDKTINNLIMKHVSHNEHGPLTLEENGNFVGYVYRSDEAKQKFDEEYSAFCERNVYMIT